MAVPSSPLAINVSNKLIFTIIISPNLSAKKPAIGIETPNIKTIKTEKLVIIVLVAGIAIGKYCFIKIIDN